MNESIVLERCSYKKASSIISVNISCRNICNIIDCYKSCIRNDEEQNQAFLLILRKEYCVNRYEY